MTNYIYIGVSVIVALVLHEFAHGYVSYHLGDPTPKVQGRLSMNPLVHLDPFGTICLFMFGFGWAKPVQINTEYYKEKKKGIVLVSLAGPFMNFILAILGVILLKVTLLTSFDGVTSLLYVFVSINLGLGLFNLIPIPPLDGSKVLYSILPTDLYFKYMRYEQYGMFLLIILLWFGVLTPFLQVMFSSVSGFLFYIFGIV